MGESSTVGYVGQSAVRTALLEVVADESVTTRRLHEEIDASESAIYEAINALVEHGLVEEAGDGGWHATGAGVIVADVLDRQARTEALLGADPDYWRNHDVRALPERARRDLAALADCEIFRATDTDPQRVVREVAARIATADRVDVVTPIYHGEFATALGRGDGTTQVRIVFGRSLLAEMPPAAEEEADADLDAEVRAADVSFALTVTEDAVLLSLPGPEGDYDGRTEVVDETASGIAWGERLFADCWAAADPLDID